MSSVDEAFGAVDRQHFLPRDSHDEAHLDMPISIGYGQTNSQPYTVKLMLRWLDTQPGERVLDVGSGSGWTSALLSHIVGENGRVYAVELVPQLLEFGRENCRRAGITNVEFHQAQSTLGLPKFAPYDRILVSASASELPQELLDQLKTNGKMVIPIGSDVMEVTKRAGDDHDIISHSGFAFVPLLKP